MKKINIKTSIRPTGKNAINIKTSANINGKTKTISKNIRLSK